MISPHIRTSIADAVLHLEIDRRDKKNSLTGDMYMAMSETLAAARDNPKVRVVLISGQADMFTAGNDLGDFLARKRGDGDSPAMHFLHQIASFDKPLVAAVGGIAIGIGTTMLLHCDLVYAADNARFQMPFVNLALCPEGASSLLLPRIAGHRLASELLFFGDAFDGHKAREAGIVNEVLPAAQLLETAMARAKRLANQPARSIAVTKGLLKRQEDRSEVLEAMKAEGMQFADLLAEPAAKEIFSAFLEKRKPDPAKIHGEGK